MRAADTSISTTRHRKSQANSADVFRKRLRPSELSPSLHATIFIESAFVMQTAATIALVGGVQPKVVSEQAGHAGAVVPSCLQHECDQESEDFRVARSEQSHVATTFAFSLDFDQSWVLSLSNTVLGNNGLKVQNKG